MNIWYVYIYNIPYNYIHIMWMVRIYDLQTALPLTLLQGTLRLAIWSEAIINEIVTVGRSPSGTSAEGWKKLRVVWLDQNKIQLLMTQYGYHMLSHVITQMFVRYVWTKSHLSWLTDKAFSIGIKNDQNTVVRECPNRRCGSMWGLWSMPKPWRRHLSNLLHGQSNQRFASTDSIW